MFKFREKLVHKNCQIMKQWIDERQPGHRAPVCLTKVGILEDMGYNDMANIFTRL